MDEGMPEEVLLDENLRKEQGKHDFYMIDCAEPSPDHNLYGGCAATLLAIVLTMYPCFTARLGVCVHRAFHNYLPRSFSCAALAAVPSLGTPTHSHTYTRTRSTCLTFLLPCSMVRGHCWRREVHAACQGVCCGKCARERSRDVVWCCLDEEGVYKCSFVKQRCGYSILNYIRTHTHTRTRTPTRLQSLATNTEVMDPITETSGDVEWGNDNATLFYTKKDHLDRWVPDPHTCVKGDAASGHPECK